MTKRKYADDEIEIVAKVRAVKGGFVPMLVINGRESWNWRPGGEEDRDVAAARARAEAREYADRYVGDWRIAVIDQTQERARKRRR